jgi:hypothetical protein
VIAGSAVKKESALHVRVHVVLRVLAGQEAGDLEDGRVEAVADVPAGGGLRLGGEDLVAADVAYVHQRHRAGGPLDASEHVQLRLVAGQQGDDGRVGGLDLPVGRLADGDGRAQGHQADAVLRREPGRRLLQEHLRHRVRLCYDRRGHGAIISKLTENSGFRSN